MSSSEQYYVTYICKNIKLNNRDYNKVRKIEDEF